MLAVRTKLIVPGNNDSLFDFVLRSHGWIKVVWSTHIYLLVVKEDREVEIVVPLVDQIPNAKVEVYIHRFLIFAI